MASSDRRSWNLESFLDSLVLELDKAQDTLAVKGVNRPLTYSVKELTIDLHVFPEFDGKRVRFSTAKSGETGASKMSFDLGSITSDQIKRTTAKPVTRDDLSLEEIEDIDEDTKEVLQKKGIHSVRDLENLEEKNVAVEKVVASTPEATKTSYKDLANIINRARRQRRAPKVKRVSLGQGRDSTELSMEGENLSIASEFQGFPAARLDGKAVPVLGATESEVKLQIRPDQLSRSSQLYVALDPFAVVKINLKAPSQKRDGKDKTET